MWLQVPDLYQDITDFRWTSRNLYLCNMIKAKSSEDSFYWQPNESLVSKVTNERPMTFISKYLVKDYPLTFFKSQKGKSPSFHPFLGCGGSHLMKRFINLTAYQKIPCTICEEKIIQMDTKYINIVLNTSTSNCMIQLGSARMSADKHHWLTNGTKPRKNELVAPSEFPSP